MENSEILSTVKACKLRCNIENEENISFMNYPSWIKEMAPPLANIINF